MAVVSTASIVLLGCGDGECSRRSSAADLRDPSTESTNVNTAVATGPSVKTFSWLMLISVK